MSRYQFSLAITVVLLAGKITTIVFLYYLLDHFVYQPDEVADVLTILAPLFSVYLTIMIKQVFSQEKAMQEEFILNWAAVLIGFAVPVLYIVFIMGCLFWKRDHMQDMDTVKRGLALIESLCGVYLGIIVSAVFKTDGQ